MLDYKLVNWYYMKHLMLLIFILKIEHLVQHGIQEAVLLEFKMQQVLMPYFLLEEIPEHGLQLMRLGDFYQQETQMLLSNGYKTEHL